MSSFSLNLCLTSILHRLHDCQQPIWIESQNCEILIPVNQVDQNVPSKIYCLLYGTLAYKFLLKLLNLHSHAYIWLFDKSKSYISLVVRFTKLIWFALQNSVQKSEPLTARTFTCTIELRLYVNEQNNHNSLVQYKALYYKYLDGHLI